MISYCIRLDFNQHRRINESFHFHHRRGRADVAEEFAMRFADQFPLLNVRHVDARPDDIFQRRARFEQGRLYVLERLYRLRVRVSDAHELAVEAGGGRARDK